MEENCTITVHPACSTTGELIAYVAVITPVCIIGIIFNSLLLAVLRQPGFKHGLAIFSILRAIGLMNLLVCCVVLPIGLCRCSSTSVYWELHAQAIYEVYVYLPLSNFFGTASLFLTVAMVLDIYIGIQFACLAKKWCTVVNVRRITALVLVLALCMNTPLYFYQEIAYDPDPRVVPSEWGMSHGADIYMWIRLVLFKFLPMVMILTIDVLLTCSIAKAYYGPRKTSMNYYYKMKLQSNICWMVLCVSLLVFCGHSLEPLVHTEIYAFLFGKCSVYDERHITLRLLSTVLELISYAFKFPIYCVFHVEFWNNLKKVLCCGSKNKVGARDSSNSTSMAETSYNETNHSTA